MYGNGVRTGMVVTVAIHRLILQDHHPALTAWFVAAAGTPARGAAVCRIVTTSAQATGATILGCAFLYLSINTKIQKLS